VNTLRAKIAILLVVAIVSVVGLLTVMLFYVLGPPKRVHSLDPVARQVETLVRVVEEHTGVEPVAEMGDIARLALSYWFFDARWPRTFLMSFSTPLVAERESVVQLCDAISAGVKWEA